MREASEKKMSSKKPAYLPQKITSNLIKQKITLRRFSHIGHT